MAITPIAATRQLTSLTPGLTPSLAPRLAAPALAPTLVPVAAPVVAPATRTSIQDTAGGRASFPDIAPARIASEIAVKTPSVVTAERAAVSQILLRPRQEDPVKSVQDIGTGVSPVASVSRKTPVEISFAVPATRMPSSDVSEKIAPAYATPAKLTQQTRTLTPGVTPAWQPRTPAVATPAWQPRTPSDAGTPINPASRTGSSVPTPGLPINPASQLAPSQDAGLLLEEPPSDLGPSPGMLSAPTPGFYSPTAPFPSYMRVRGVQDHYRNSEPFIETNVITPQVSMPTQVSTQTPAQAYQVPSYDPSGGQIPYVGTAQQQVIQEAPLDTAYKAVKVLAIAGIGIGAIYWLVGKLAPKVQFK